VGRTDGRLAGRRVLAPPIRRSQLTIEGSQMSEVAIENYRPAEDEPYMNQRQTEYFRRKLLAWREDILRGSGQTLRQLKEEDTRLPDATDWAAAEMQRSFELRTRDRDRKLLSKIEAALRRIEDGSYGYCEESQEPIGIKRLDARPIATLSIEAQERHERREKIYRED
jgi:DnaK suppressor protein